jgi:putative transposase
MFTIHEVASTAIHAGCSRLLRMISSRLTVVALERAVANRQPQAGLMHHPDRRLQYASPEYVARLDKYGIVASMSGPANPYDNASCEHFMKTLKREEIYANRYNLEQWRMNIEESIEEYYNRHRLHSALGYRREGPPLPRS